MKDFLNKILDLIYSQCCLVCKKEISSNLKNKICLECGEYFIRNVENKYKVLDEISVYSIYDYSGKTRDAILNLKNGKKELYEFFGEKLFFFWKEIINKNQDFFNYSIIPIPSHEQRIKKRGYCQIKLIANKFATLSGLNYCELLGRKINTKFMNDLNLVERKLNIKNAFEILNNQEYPREIILIDDIVTTGSTLNEAAKIIKEKNPKVKIVGLTIASGDKFSP